MLGRRHIWPTFVRHCQADPVEVARDVWKRQVCCDVWSPAEIIEMAALRTAGDWLKHWYNSLRTTLVARTRRADHLTVAALYILQYRAYKNRDTDTEDEPLGLMNDAQRGKRAVLNSGIGQQSCHWTCVYWTLRGPNGSPPSACTSTLWQNVFPGSLL